MIFFSCGEQSGDEYAANIARHIQSMNPNVAIFGNAGDALSSVPTAQLLHHVTERSSVGLIEPIQHIPFFYRVLRSTKRFLKQQKYPIVLTIDHQGFNIPLAKWCYAHHIPVISLFSPQYWLWGNQQKAVDFSSFCKHVFCVFKQEFDTYQSLGIQNCSYIGHPILSRTPYPLKKRDLSGPIQIGLFPGSRQQEINRLLPIFLDAAKQLQKQIPDATFCCAVSSDKFIQVIQRMIRLSGMDVSMTKHPLKLIQSATASITTSGTITLPHALFQTPCVCTYALNPISYQLVKRFIWPSIEQNCNGYIALPNIIMKEEIMPELIQTDVTGQTIATTIQELIRSNTRPLFDNTLLRADGIDDPCFTVAHYLHTLHG